MSGEAKLERLARICHDAGVGGVVLQTQANFAWITDGASNRIDGSRELGAGAILIAADGRRFILANAIEMPRLRCEALAGLAYDTIEYPWVDEHARPDSVADLARRALGSNGIGADWGLPGAVPLDRQIARARAPLTESELHRYRSLGRDAGGAIGRACRLVASGMTEHEVARMASEAIAGAGARAIVMLVAADDRIRRYRHPVSTAMPWQRVLMVVVCAQRDGLVVSLSRLVCAGPPPPALVELTAKTAAVFGRLLDATRDGARGRQLYDAAVRAYAEQGYPGEERLHHQGGATGYRSREWLAHPASDETVHAPQAFAWNPTITGTKVEETAVLTRSGIEIITTSPGWPTIDVTVAGGCIQAPGVLQVA